MHEFYSHLPLNKGAMVSKRKRQTESLTLRIDKDLLDKLRKESEQKMVSINTLTNLIIKSYIK
ncbi:MAG: hypothetical protein QN715_09840, partial [Nitrososphaeraceae archaeon]|nr:hypothetical protein [Nitrososphaeraceae archaeon]